MSGFLRFVTLALFVAVAAANNFILDTATIVNYLREIGDHTIDYDFKAVNAENTLDLTQAIKAKGSVLFEVKTSDPDDKDCEGKLALQRGIDLPKKCLKTIRYFLDEGDEFPTVRLELTFKREHLPIQKVYATLTKDSKDLAKKYNVVQTDPLTEKQIESIISSQEYSGDMEWAKKIIEKGLGFVAEDVLADGDKEQIFIAQPVVVNSHIFDRIVNMLENPGEEDVSSVLDA